MLVTSASWISSMLLVTPGQMLRLPVAGSVTSQRHLLCLACIKGPVRATSVCQHAGRRIKLPQTLAIQIALHDDVRFNLLIMRCHHVFHINVLRPGDVLLQCTHSMISSSGAGWLV